MFTYTEMIVGLWFVLPAILCLLVPLTMLCVWAIMQLSKKMTQKIEHIKQSAKGDRGNSFVDGFNAHHTA